MLDVALILLIQIIAKRKPGQLMNILIESFIALFAGILLNLMPCVLPVIPIKIKTILKSTDHHFNQRVIASLFYLSGTLLFFLVLGGLIGMLNFFWGSFFQSTVFLWALVIFFLIAGTSLCLDFQIPLPDFIYNIHAHHYWSPFISGLMIAVLSTPCTGPFLGGLIAFALLQPLAINLWLFALVGFGLALPVMLFILCPKLLQYFPAQREWTDFLKSLLGWVLIASGVYFLHSLISEPWDFWTTYGFLAAFIVWTFYTLFKAQQWPTRALSIIVLLCFLIGVLWPFAPAKSLDWQPFSQKALTQAKRQHRPVLVEFTADWCINCKVLEKTVYRNKTVLDAAKKTRLLSLRVDLTRSNREYETLLQQWGGRGLPFAVLLNSNGEVVKRLPDIFFASTLTNAILNAGSKP